MRLYILGIAHAWIFVTKPDTVGQHAITQRPIGLWQAMCLCGHFCKAHTRLDQADIRHDMLIGNLVERPLFIRRPGVPDNPAARYIAAIAMRADKIGVKGHHVTFLHDSRTAFLKPGIGARTRRQDTRLDPFAPAFDIAGMKRRPHFIFRYARAHCIPHFINGTLAGMNGTAHGIQLIGILDRPRMFGQHLAFQHINIIGAQCGIADMFDTVDSQSLVLAAKPGHQVKNNSHKFISRSRCPVAGFKIEEAGTMAHLTNQGQMLRQMFAIVEIPQDDIALRRHKTGARWIMRGPELHVCCIGGIADVQRVKQ